jgi:outer membrane lipoprotein carrier protein
MNRLFILLCLALIPLAPSTGFAADDTVALVDAFREISGHEAEFIQRFLPRGYKKEQVETGRVTFGVPPASRWTYTTPEEKTFVFDGETSWMYVPADEAVMVHRVSQQDKNRLPFFVLSDAEKLADWYRIETKGARSTLTARNENALLRSITIDRDASGHVKSLSYVDTQGNSTTFDLGGWKKTSITAETFTFSPPPGVDVIQN